MLAVVGVSHKVAPVALRERVVYGSEQTPAALATLRAALDEAVLLSTCNRTEVFACGADPAPAVRDYLRQAHALQTAELEKYFYVHLGAAAVRHLFTVAAGLDSMVVGESQILGQVKAALQAAQSVGAAGPLLMRLFESALRVGKLVRSTTGIGREHLSVGQAAADLARTFFAQRYIQPKDVLVVGAGETASLVARGLAVNGIGPMIVANRTFTRAQTLAAELRGRAIRFDAVPRTLAEVDVVICASAAPHAVLDREQVAHALPYRDGRPLFIIDIAVPRDVEPAVGRLPGVQLFNIDQLQGICDRALRNRQRAADRALEIVAAETDAFQQWIEARAAVPAIRALREQAEGIRRAEVEKTLRRMGELSPEQRRAVEALSRAIIGKLLHQPTIHLRQPPAEQPCPQYIDCLSMSFGLPVVSPRRPQ